MGQNLVWIGNAEVLQVVVDHKMENECEARWHGIEIGDDGYPIALIEYKPCCPTPEIQDAVNEDLVS